MASLDVERGLSIRLFRADGSPPVRFHRSGRRPADSIDRPWETSGLREDEVGGGVRARLLEPRFPGVRSKIDLPLACFWVVCIWGLTAIG